MASQIEHDTERLMAYLEKTLKILEAGDVDKTKRRIEHAIIETRLMLLTMAGYSLEEAEAIVYE